MALEGELSNLHNPVAELICVGTELLLGDILNTNAQFIAQELAHLGITHHYQTVVGDNPARLQQVIEVASRRANLLILSGGLGPTPDDLTTETLAETFHVPLVKHPDIEADIQQKFSAIGRIPSPSNFKQALLPEGAQVLPNPTGTAPGCIWSPKANVLIMTFPGVPHELKTMWFATAAPYLRQAKGLDSSQFVSRTLHFFGIGESSLAESIAPLLASQNPTLATYAGDGLVKVRITAKANSEQQAWDLIAPVEKQLRLMHPQTCFGADAQTLASVVSDALISRKETLAVAESCTGGGLGSLLTEQPGSSVFFQGGIIAYHNSIKSHLLQVDPAVLSEQGAVSGIVAEQMAQGVCRQCDSTWGISITGIAGPAGGSDDKPVGLVYIGLAHHEGWQQHWECRWGAQRSRSRIRSVSVLKALDVLRLFLLKNE